MKKILIRDWKKVIFCLTVIVFTVAPTVVFILHGISIAESLMFWATIYIVCGLVIRGQIRAYRKI